MGWIKVEDECEYCGALYAEPTLRCTQCGAPLVTQDDYPETYFYEEEAGPNHYFISEEWFNKAAGSGG